jgi:hypothetical protein
MTSLGSNSAPYRLEPGTRMLPGLASGVWSDSQVATDALPVEPAETGCLYSSFGAVDIGFGPNPPRM